MVKGNNYYLSTFIFLLISPVLSFGALFTSQIDGDWNDPATWGETVALPGPGDDVLINGNSVAITTTDVTINNLTITNTLGSQSDLEIHGSLSVNILGDVTLTADNFAADVNLQIFESSIVTISGDLLMERTANNAQDDKLSLIIYNSAQLFVNGSFNYFYRNSNGEFGYDIQMYNTAKLTVSGKSVFQQDGGSTLSMLMTGSCKATFQDSLNITLNSGTSTIFDISNSALFTVDETLTLNNTGGDNELRMTALLSADINVGGSVHLLASPTRSTKLQVYSSTSEIDINEDLILDATDSDAAIVDLNNSKMYLGGDLLRTNSYGVLKMSNSTELHFDGTSRQTIPRSKIDGIETDSFQFTQLYFENTDGFNLDGNVTIESDMILTEGIIYTSEDSLLIINDGVDIMNGSRDSYIDGPMVKRGTHSGSTFTFPVGDNGIYAPFGIDAITNSSVEYTAKAIGCPPPIGVHNGDLKNINNEIYWEVFRNDGAAVGDITLHWDQASLLGLTDINSLVVAYFSPATGWNSLGRSGLIGSILGLLAGAITNDIGCPPPIGIQTFAFGSTAEGENALPIELNSFKAFKSQDQTMVFLEWQTITEENSDYFVIEKSLDGISFVEVDRVRATQNSTTTQYYSSVDLNPQKGNNYYRIQEVDQSQMMSFSNLVNVFFNGQEDIPIIYPNPVENQVRVFSKDLENKVFNIKVLDLNGQCLYSGSERAQDGQLFISTSNLNIKNPGVYFFSYEIGGETKSLKFMKVK